MLREVERVQMPMNGQAQIVLQIEAGFGAQIATKVLQPKARGSHQGEGSQPWPKRAPTRNYRVIDDNLLQ